MTFQEIASKHLFILDFKRKKKTVDHSTGKRNIVISRKEDVMIMNQDFKAKKSLNLDLNFSQIIWLSYKVHC